MKTWLLFLFTFCTGVPAWANGAPDATCDLPMAVCQPYNAVLDATGNATIIPANVDGGSTYDCGLLSMTVSPDQFTCADVGSNTVVLTVTDVNGNTSTCSVTVTVSDVTPPTALCQDITLSLDEDGEAAFLLIDHVFYDYSCDRTSFAFSNVSQSFTATTSGFITQLAAGIGNWGFSHSYGTVVSSTSNMVDYGNLTYSGRCCYDECAPGNNMAFTTLPVAFYVNAGETVTISFTGTGGDLHYEDNQLRLLVSGSIYEVSIDDGSTDACGIASLAFNPGSFTCEDMGENIVTLTATDASGNSATCTATVTIEDNTPPVAVCQDVTLNLDENGEAGFPLMPIVFYDYSCDRNSLAFSPVSQSFTASTSGYITQIGAGIGSWGSPSSYGTVISSNSNTVDYGSLTYSGRCCYDECAPGNNMAFTTLPVAFYVNAGETITISFTGSGGDLHYQDNQLRLLVSGELPGFSSLDGGSTDACGISSFTATPNEFTCEDVGPNTVTVTVTDVNGNSSTCNATVTIEDNIAPEALCQNITIQLDQAGNASIEADQIDNGSNDNCAIGSLNVVPNTFDCSNMGANTVTLTVTDVNGNTSTCTATVTVEDNIAPTVICPANSSEPYNAGTCTEIAVPDPVIDDNCAATKLTWVMTGVTEGSSSETGINYVGTQQFNFGVTNITYTVIDASGNSNSCAFMVTVTPGLTTSVISLSPSEQQYSDALTFTVTIAGGASGMDCDPKWEAAQSATFFVGSQEMGSADFEVEGTDLVATLEDICLLEGVIGQMAPGTKSVSAIISGIDDVHFIVDQPDDVDLLITQEDALLEYNGQEYFSTPSPTNCTGTVTMSAYVGDVDDTPIDCRGDIRNATVTFSNYGIPGTTLGTPNLPVGLINPDNIHEGIAVNVFDHTLQGGTCSSGGETFEVWLKAGNYYTGETTQDDVTLVTLALPGNEFVTGGGHLVVTNSAGTYAGTAGSKMNFGFNMKWNPGGSNLQGAINIIFRKLVNGVWHTYQIKSNKINSMVVNESDPDYRKAFISTKANLKDITDPLNPISLGGNLNLAMNAWESTTENNGSLDKIGVTLTGSGSAGLLFSSHWVGTGTVEQIINGGKIQVRASSQNQYASPEISNGGVLPNNDPQPVNESNPNEEKSISYVVQNQPNPFNNETVIKFELATEEDLVLKVFNQFGQLVSVLHEGRLSKGAHSFTFYAGDHPAGMFIYTLSSGSKSTTGKMLLVK